MRQFSIFLFALSMVMGWGVSVVCAAPYVSGNLGYVWLEDSELKDHWGDAGKLSFDRGLAINVAVGNALSERLRAEVEFGYKTNEANEIEHSNGEKSSIDSDMLTLSLMANCFYDFMPSNLVSPFVGVGIGIASVEGEIGDIDDKDNVLAYQLAAGAAFKLNDNVKFDIQYRFFGTDDPEFDGVEAEYTTHNLLFGLRASL
jgi:opacity protein-like surface antigen